MQSQYLSLHRIFELDLPDRYELSCHGGDSGTFRPNIVVRLALDEAYGGELLKSTASLDGNERAKALAAGLRDTRLLRTPNVGKVVGLIGQLVGKEEGAAILPEWYKPWLGAVPARGG